MVSCPPRSFLPCPIPSKVSLAACLRYRRPHQKLLPNQWLSLWLSPRLLQPAQPTLIGPLSISGTELDGRCIPQPFMGLIPHLTKSPFRLRKQSPTDSQPPSRRG